MIKHTWNEVVSLPQPRDDFREVVLTLTIDESNDLYEIMVDYTIGDGPSLNKSERSFIEEEYLPMLEDSWSNFMAERGEGISPALWLSEDVEDEVA